jgi:hypothetical protein
MPRRITADGYKVLRVVEGALMSPGRNDSRYGNMTLKYSIGTPTKPADGCGPLCVFESVRESMDYMIGNNYPTSMYACSYVPSRMKSVWFAKGTSASTRYMFGWMNDGTILADSVTVTGQPLYTTDTTRGIKVLMNNSDGTVTDVLHNPHGDRSQMTGYKVLVPAKKALFSTCLCFSSCNGVAVRYRLGMPTAPKLGSGPLCVFSTLESAETFISASGALRSYGKAEVYECTFTPTSIEWLWGNKETAKSRYRSCSLPTGTALSSSVTITRKVASYRERSGVWDVTRYQNSATDRSINNA